MDQLSASRGDAEHFLLPDLSQMRILIVGGLPKMELLYRRLIEESGDMFDYHNGQMWSYVPSIITVMGQPQR